ncbi:hypothetical protein SHIRM173S_11444 [Streptomyces hirsutus]
MTAEDLAVALDMNDVISASVTATLRRQHAEAEFRSLPLWVPSGAGPPMETLRAVLDVAEEAARDERFLTLPALPRGHGFQEWLFDQIGDQLAGERPTAWTVMPREPGAGASEPVLWDAGQVQASRVATIAADESNRIIAVNGPAADLLGWPADELVGQPLTALMPEHLRRRHTVAFTSLLLSGQPRILGRSLPLPALHRDGGLVPVRLFVESQETADGRTVFVAQLSPRGSVPSPSPRPSGQVRPGATREAGGAPWPAFPGRDRRTGVGRAGGTSELERLSLLADTGAALSTLPDLNEGLRRVGRILTRWLADWCLVDLFTTQDEVERVCVMHRAPQGPWPEEYEGRLPPLSETARGPLARVLRGAGPLLLREPLPQGRAASPLDAHYGELFRKLGANSAVVAPLRSPREVIGALTIARKGRGRPFTEEDLPLVDELVRAIALRVDNARLHQETRKIAERLQRSLLPALPEIPGLQLAARYAASSATAEVGGDWYDCFVLPDGDTALVIGDVAGHDLDAAIAMSQLRSMLRGIAVDRQEPPGEVLRRLDIANRTLYEEATATCVYGLVKELGNGLWEFAHSAAGQFCRRCSSARTAVPVTWRTGRGCCSAWPPTWSAPRPTTRSRPTRPCCCTPTASSSAGASPWTIPWTGSAGMPPGWPANPSVCSATSCSSAWPPAATTTSRSSPFVPGRPPDGGRGEAVQSASAASTLSGVSGRSRKRMPVAWCTALPMAAAVPTMPISPIPLLPMGLRWASSSSIQCASMRGTSACTGTW